LAKSAILKGVPQYPYSLYPPTSHPFKGRRLLKERQKAVKKI